MGKERSLHMGASKVSTLPGIASLGNSLGGIATFCKQTIIAPAAAVSFELIPETVACSLLEVASSEM